MAKTSKKPKMGRPPLPPEKRKLPSMGFRPTAEMRKQLEEASANSGLSLTQEVERRLERSLRDEDQLGGLAVYRLALIFGLTKQLVEKVTEGKFESDRFTFDQVVESWTAVLAKLRPADDQIDLLSDPVVEKELYGRQYGKRIGEEVLAKVGAMVEKIEPKQRSAKKARKR